MECPSDKTLALLLEGGLRDADATALREHLGSCEKCAGVYQDKTRATGFESTSPLAAAAPQGTMSMPARETPFGIAEPHAGLVIGGRYRLERWLGEGGMGTVWAVEHVLTHQKFALKLIRTSQAQRPGTRRRMLREAKVASTVHHPNVVHIVDAFVAAQGTPVLVMDLLEGRTLRQRLHLGRLSLDEAARLLVPAMAAIKSAHAAGVIHRDLKPDNLFLVALPGGREDVRVLDFGLARLIAVDANSSQLTRSGEMLGTPSYMSPEQAFGETDLDERSDVWAMGVILYECLGGRRPFEGENFGQVLKRITSGDRPTVGEVAPGLPDDVAALVERMLTVPRERRLVDLGEAIEVLSRHGDGEIEARVIRPRRRTRLAVALGAVLAVAAATTGMVLARPWAHAVSPAEPPAAAEPPAKAPTTTAPVAVDVATRTQPVDDGVLSATPPSPANVQPPPRPVGKRTIRGQTVRAPATGKSPAPAVQMPPRVQRENDL
jgi:serine/threonine-protein kinase